MIQKGFHTATIADINPVERKGFAYVDISLEMQDKILRYSVPANLSKASRLGAIVMDFGLATDEQLDAETDINLSSLCGKPAEVLIEHVTKDGRTFANVTKLAPAN